MTWQPINDRHIGNAPSTIPDDNTQEMIAYGTAYTQVKLQLRTINRVISALETGISDVLSRMDTDLYESMRSEPGFAYIVSGASPVPDGISFSEAHVIACVRTAARHMRAIEVLRDRRDRIIEVGRTIGAAEQSARVAARGPMQVEWQIAAMRFDAQHPVAADPVDIIYAEDES